MLGKGLNFVYNERKFLFFFYIEENWFWFWKYRVGVFFVNDI